MIYGTALSGLVQPWIPLTRKAEALPQHSRGMDGNEPFHFDWKWLVPSGLSVKDFIAPSSFEFREGRVFKTGGKFGAVSFLQILAPELNDRILADFLT